MSYNITTKDITVLGQKTKSYFIKIELLNNNFQLLDIIEGNCLSCSLDIDSSADIRRTVTLTMLIRDPRDLFSPTSKIWINRYLRIYLGIQSIRTEEILWYPLILCVPSEDTYTYDASARTLEVKCVDFMSALINTPLYGTTTHIIPAGSNIRSALIAALKLANVKKYNICEISSITDSSANTVPYDISMDSNSSVYDLVKKLLELYAGYEIFADLDTIVVQRIPTTIEDGIVLSDDILKSKGLIISESITNSLNIKNVTEIFGKQIETDYYSESVTLSGNQYNVTVDGLSGLVDGMQIALKLPSANPVNAMIKINSFTAYPITDSSDTVLQSNLINGYNVFKFHNNCFEYLGQYQVHGICMLLSNEPTNEAKAYYQQYFNCDNIFYRVSPNNEFTIEKLSTSLYEQKYLSGQNITLFRTLSEGKIDSLFITGQTVQDGSGDPSPDNVRPLHGVQQITLSDGGSQSQTIALPQPLYSLPDGTADEYDAVSGRGTANILAKTYNGTEAWYKAAIDTTNLAGFGITERQSGNKNILCDRLNVATVALGSAREQIHVNTASQVFVRVLKSRLAGWSDSWTDAQKAAAFKAWLAANPVTVLYELATPQAISGEAQDILPYQDYTNISNDANAIMDVTYSEYPASFNYWIDGCRIDTKSGNDYDSIYSQELVIERCKFENWKTSRLNRTLSLTTQTIPFLDVNQKFTYKSKIDNVLRQWIITKINFSNVVAGTINLEATEFFDTYPETYE